MARWRDSEIPSEALCCPFSLVTYPFMTRRIALIAEGDANTPDCWSGSGQRFVEALRATGARVDVYDANPRSWWRALAIVCAFHPSRARWRQRYGLGRVSFMARSARVNRMLSASGVRYDAVVQIGATFAASSVARQGALYILYCDANVAYARQGAPFSAASRLPPSDLSRVANRERKVYDSADAIWTMSGALARSFRDDFAQAETKLRTIYAGVNNPPAPLQLDRTTPNILFVGKDHARKGSAVLLEAFDCVRELIPNAELHLVGGIPPNAGRPGVFVHGVVTRSTQAGRETLDRLFGSASVFCMPSRYEPFGIAFAEAMLAGLACIGTTRWAMPEIIVDGETGWLVPDGSVDELARVLVNAFSDRAACARMGAKGRERSEAIFTWERVAGRAIDHLESLLGRATERPTARIGE